jgi:nucleoside-diphosphate-sugar epimerase
MTALVTGGAGFLGKRVVEELLARGQSVCALVRKPEQAEALRRSGARTIIGDVRDAATRQAVRDAQVVYHCAAAVGPSYSAQDIFDVNLGGARNVMEAMCDGGRGRVVLVSTINVLGLRSFDNATEDFPCRRAGEPNADVKIEVEHLARRLHHQRALDVVIVRPPLIYGPREHNIPRILSAVRRVKFAYIGSRENLVPMVHIDDAAQAILLAGSVAGANGRIYHFSDGARTTMGELIDTLAELIGCTPPQKVLPYMVPAVACRVFEWLRRLRLMRGPGPINRNSLRFLGTSRSLDITRARQELGYEPKVGFRHAIAATVRWIEEHDQHGAPTPGVKPAAAR